MNIMPIHPEDAAPAESGHSTCDRPAGRRTLGIRRPMRRAFGRRLPSRRALAIRRP